MTDGLVRWPDPVAALLDAIDAGDTGADGLLVRAWLETADIATTLAAPDAAPPTIAAVLTGPCTLAAAAGLEPDASLTLARRLQDELVALAEAGCTLAIIDEPAATTIGTDERARRRFREAHAAPARRRAAAPRDARDHRWIGVGGGRGDDPRGAVRVLPVRPHRGPRQLVSRPRRAR